MRKKVNLGDPVVDRVACCMVLVYQRAMHGEKLGSLGKLELYCLGCHVLK